MADNSDLSTFMKNKAKEKVGEKIVVLEEEVEPTIVDLDKPIAKEAGVEDIKVAKLLLLIRKIIILLFTLPLIGSCIFILYYIMVNFLPSILHFLKILFFG